MARTTISLPDDLKREMDKMGGDANWSALAAATFLAEINKIKARKSALKGKPMDAAIDRLRHSKKVFLGAARERGKDDGTAWAMDTAAYGELKYLADSWPLVKTSETTDALGAAAVVLRLFSESDVDRDTVRNFWDDLGKVPFDEDLQSPQYWDGFVEGAVEVYKKIDD